MQITATKDAVDAKDEPSMEEILASIRKIISEQDAPPVVVEAPVVQEDVAVVEEDEEPFELTQVLEDDGSITDLAVLRAPPATFEEMLDAEVNTVESSEEITAVVDVVFETQQDDVVEESIETTQGFVQEPEAFAVFEAVETINDGEIDDVMVEDMLVETVVGDVSVAESIIEDDTASFLPPHLDIHEQLENIAAEMNKEDEEFTMKQVFEEEPVSSVPAVEGLLSTTAAQASLAALANLKRTLAQPTPVKVSTEEGRTVEDLLGDLLKPLLKEWLDTNLPPMIENIVTAEIKKLTSNL